MKRKLVGALVLISGLLGGLVSCEMKNKEIMVLDQKIHINKDDYFSLTDIARYRNQDAPAAVVKNWLRRKDTIGFLGLWE